MGVATENLAIARVTGEISFNAKRMKINDPAHKRMIVVKKMNEVDMRWVVKPSLIPFGQSLGTVAAIGTDSPNDPARSC
jgi:hypothetical protein